MWDFVAPGRMLCRDEIDSTFSSDDLFLQHLATFYSDYKPCRKLGKTVCVSARLKPKYKPADQSNKLRRCCV